MISSDVIFSDVSAVPGSRIVGAVKFDDGVVGVAGAAVAEGYLRKGCRSATTAHLPLLWKSYLV